MTDCYLLRGDPRAPSSTDTLAEFARLAVGKPVPNGWRVLSGNATDSEIARVAYRFEIAAERPNPAFCVDGRESADPDSPLAGDGQFAPFLLFCPESQDYVPGASFATREAAQAAADYLNERESS